MGQLVITNEQPLHSTLVFENNGEIVTNQPKAMNVKEYSGEYEIKRRGYEFYRRMESVI
ncbi:hypothetical protein [Bacillus sp. FDAARGOS_1420]|uniref:hypothetical protein n=1 Tax=unclassified Bacillus (in: firmicutes) TaxID=185979 RepID=UPI001C5B46FC|nr:hypothetical protein [Bacillus sp. FDAARGOS_1420]MBW3493221.1 hypothetical protein [Bacillus sp. FDAARGOS_1420]